MGDGGKRDMDRVGLFSEAGYLHGKYQVAKGFKPGSFREEAGKGRQMLPGGTKERCATRDGYFGQEFTRIFTREGYSSPFKLRHQERMAAANKNLATAFTPSSGYKTMNGSGTNYGTLGGNVSSFSPETVKERKKDPPLRNVITNPCKKGTGYGYASVALNPYPNHDLVKDDYHAGIRDLRNDAAKHRAAIRAGAFSLNMHPTKYFDGNPYKSDKHFPLKKQQQDTGKMIGPNFRPSNPGKNPAGYHAGTFNPYPANEGKSDPYGVRQKREPKPQIHNKIFTPNQCAKTMPIKSIVNKNVDRTMNITNYRSVTGRSS